MVFLVLHWNICSEGCSLGCGAILACLLVRHIVLLACICVMGCFAAMQDQKADGKDKASSQAYPGRNPDVDQVAGDSAGSTPSSPNISCKCRRTPQLVRSCHAILRMEAAWQKIQRRDQRKADNRPGGGSRYLETLKQGRPSRRPRETMGGM